MFLSAQLRGVAAAASLLMLTTVNAQEVLETGKRYRFGPEDTQCYTQTSGAGGSLLPVVEASCNNNTGRADMRVSTRQSLKALDLASNVRFQKWFRLADAPDATEQSLVPVTIKIPNVRWNLWFFNDSILASFGTSGANILVTVRENPTVENPSPGNSAARGRIIGQKIPLSYTHGGVGAGCALAVPAALAKANVGGIVKCIAAAPDRVRSSGPVEMVAMMKPGRTYNIEIELQGFATTKANIERNLVYMSSPRVSQNGNPPAMKWDDLIINVSTDPRAVVADLQTEIDELRTLLENHTHNYRTGKGKGHNNKRAVTSTILPSSR